MKKIFLCIFAAVLLSSCSNDDADNKPLLLKNYTEYYNISPNNYTVLLEKSKSYNYVYDGNKIFSLIIENYSDGVIYNYEKRIFTYTGDLITKISHTNVKSDGEIISSFDTNI